LQGGHGGCGRNSAIASGSRGGNHTNLAATDTKHARCLFIYAARHISEYAIAGAGNDDSVRDVSETTVHYPRLIHAIRGFRIERGVCVKTVMDVSSTREFPYLWQIRFAKQTEIEGVRFCIKCRCYGDAERESLNAVNKIEVVFSQGLD